MLTLPALARALNGKVERDHVRAPGPGHSAKDDSLVVWLTRDGGFRVSSFADPWSVCRDYVAERLGRSPSGPVAGPDRPQIQFARQRPRQTTTGRRRNPPIPSARRATYGAAARPSRPTRRPIATCGGARLCRARSRRRLGYLPPRKPEHHPALIAAFAFADRARARRHRRRRCRRARRAFD